MLLYTLKKYSDDEAKSMLLFRGFKVYYVIELNDNGIGANRGLIRHVNFGMGKQVPEAHYIRKNSHVEVVNDPEDNRMLHVLMDYIEHRKAFSLQLRPVA